MRDRHTRPVHLRPASLALVWVGGAAGTTTRYLIGSAAPRWSGVPVATVAINVVGSFALGLLLTLLTRYGPDRGRRRGLRLLLGTGFLGGFTTYSALAVDTAGLVRDGRAASALACGLVTVLAGALAALLGVTLARGARR